MEGSSELDLTKQENSQFSPKIAQNGQILNFSSLPPETFNFWCILSVSMLILHFQAIVFEKWHDFRFLSILARFHKISYRLAKMVPETSRMGQMAYFRRDFDQVMQKSIWGKTSQKSNDPCKQGLLKSYVK